MSGSTRHEHHTAHHATHSEESRHDLIDLLFDIHWGLLHTCVHKKETICGERCIDHILHELNAIMWELKDAGSDISDLEHDHPSLDHSGATDKVHTALVSMCREIDHLDVRLRKFLHEHGEHGIHGSNVVAVITDTCEILRSTYNGLIAGIHAMGLIDEKTNNELHLSLS